MQRPTSLAALLLSFLIPAIALAEEPEPRVIRVSGEATVRESPDQAEVEVGVLTTAKRAPDASAENAEKVEKVLAAMRKVLGEKAEIRTAGYSLSPNQHWPERGGTPEITGYTASNVVRARLRDLAKVGTVIDAAMEAGANQIQSLAFSLRDEEKVRERALALAAERARAKAAALAAALDVELGRVLAVEEEQTGGPPVFHRSGMAVAAMKAESASTPIEAGEIDVSASVRLAIEIAR